MMIKTKQKKDKRPRLDPLPSKSKPKTTGSREQPEQPSANILFQPSKAIPKKVVDDSSSEEDSEEKFQLGVAQSSDSESSFKFIKKGEVAQSSDDEGAGPLENSEQGQSDVVESEGGEDEISEATESDCEVSSSDDDLKITESQKAVQVYAKESSDEDQEEEKKDPVPSKKALTKVTNAGTVREIVNNRKPGKDEIEVEFQYVAPNEAYYHQVKALLNQYVDVEDGEEMDYMKMADHICERASIGQVVVSPLDAHKDPEQMSEFEDLSDETFAKRAQKYYAERDVFAFSTILSLTWAKLKGKKPHAFAKSLSQYVMVKAAKYCNKGGLADFKRILETKNVGLLLAERMINLPASIVPSLHTELPDDLAFTKEQDDIDDPKEFNYTYLLIMSRFTIPVKSAPGEKEQEKLFYKWEDSVLWPASEVSFTFKATFSYLDDEGNKKTFKGTKDGKEVQHRLVYLIKYDRYLEEIKKLSAMVQ